MRYFIGFLCIVLSVLLADCAKRGTIDGGHKDTLPPILLKVSPPNYVTQMDDKVIKLTFDEFVKLEKINQQLVISPPMNTMPDITPMGFANKTVTIKILDTLQPNTTYSLEFGNSITDNNEGNVFKNFKYVFSTGDVIDSLRVRVRVTDAFDRKMKANTKVMLYAAENFTDSTLFKKKPLYVANLGDSLQMATIENVRAGEFVLVALNESNNNYKYDPNTDALGFYNTTISVPTDSTYALTLFKRKIDDNFGKPSMVSKQKFLVPAKGNLREAEIEVTDFKQKLASAFYKVPNKDSLYVFVNNVPSDSLQFKMTMGDLVKDYTVKTRALRQADSLSLRFSTIGNIGFNDTLRLNATTPITKVDATKITVLQKGKTAGIEKNLILDQLTNELWFLFPKEENAEYEIVVEAGAITDLFGKENKMIQNKILTTAFADYAQVNFIFSHPYKIPLIVQLLSDKDEIKMQQELENNDWKISNLLPGKYFLRVIVDENANGYWDSGDYLLKKQPEKVIYLPNMIDARANWIINEQVTIP